MGGSKIGDQVTLGLRAPVLARRVKGPTDADGDGIAGLDTGTLFASVQLARLGLRSPARPRNDIGLWENKLCITDSEGRAVGLLVARDGSAGMEDESRGTFKFTALSVSKVKNVVLENGVLKEVSERDLRPPSESWPTDEIDTSAWTQCEEPRDQT